MKSVDNKIAKISAILVILVVLSQFFWNLRGFCVRYNNIKEIQTLNNFSIVVTKLLHATQQERGASAGYIGSNGKKFTKILSKKILQTNQAIEEYKKFLQSHKFNKGYFVRNIHNIDCYLKDLPSIRKKVQNLNINLISEINFYTSLNANLLHTLTILVKISNNAELMKRLAAYANFEEAKENMGIERAILSVLFSKDRWSEELYLKYVQIINKEEVFINKFKLITDKHSKEVYSDIVKNHKLFKQIEQIEKMVLLKKSNFGIDPVKWYYLITKKIDLMGIVSDAIYKSNLKIIHKIKNQMLFDILLNLGISLIIVIIVLYNLYLLNKENNLLKNKLIYDDLTGLYNRFFFVLEFELFKARANRTKSKIAILFIDLDGFKDINDSLGHEIGDEVLKEVAKRIKSIVRKEDIVARFGGDEFLIMVDISKNIDMVCAITNKMLRSLKEPIVVKNIKNQITASIGVSIYPDDAKDVSSLIKNADIAMYKSKQKGKDRVTFYENKMGKEVEKRLKLKNDIFDALKNSEFEVFYQPQFNKSQKLCGAEALIRWNHPENGLVTPLEFIPLAMELDLMDDIDLWVMKNVAQQIYDWMQKGYDVGVVSCNLTLPHLEKGLIDEQLKNILDEVGVDGKYFGLEITEEGAMRNPKKMISLLQKIKKLNLTLSIDDFGSGYSSFSYLKKMPIDRIKIDKTLIDDIEKDEDSKAIVSSIVALAKIMGLKTIAEGVESKAQEDVVFECGCDAIQGFLYSKPLPSDEFEREFLKR